MTLTECHELLPGSIFYERPISEHSISDPYFVVSTHTAKGWGMEYEGIVALRLRKDSWELCSYFYHELLQNFRVPKWPTDFTHSRQDTKYMLSKAKRAYENVIQAIDFADGPTGIQLIKDK